MKCIRFLAGKDSVLNHLRDADMGEIASAIRRLEEDKQYREQHPNSAGGEMSWEERKKKYDEFYDALAIVANERFSKEVLIGIFRLAF